MPVLRVRCPGDPLARVELRTAGLALLVSGTGDVDRDVPPGLYEVTAGAAGRRDAQVVKVDGQDVTVELRLAGYPSAAAGTRSSTTTPEAREATDRASRSLLEVSAGHGGLIVVGTAPRSGEVPMALAASASGPARLQWTIDRPADVAHAVAELPPGSYSLTAGRRSPTALAVPVWAGWRTVLSIPSVDDELVPWLAALHTLPNGVAWSDAQPLVDLTSQIQWASIERTPLTASGLRLFDDLVNDATRALGSPTPPAIVLLLAHLVLTHARGEDPARARDLVAALRALQTELVAPSDLAALDIRLAEAASEEVVEPGRLSSPPVLASSADAILRYDARRPGLASGQLAAAFAARLASPLWFRWAPDLAPAPRSTPFDQTAWRREVERFVRRSPSVEQLDRMLRRRGLVPAAVPVLAHVADAAVVRRQDPADVVLQSPVAELVPSTGLPAVELLAGLQAVNRPPWWLRWRSRVLLPAIAALVGVAAWQLWPDPDPEPTPDDPVVVTGTNAAPVAGDDAERTTEDVEIAIDVLENDEDADGDSLTITSASAGRGRATPIEGERIRYEPPPDESGEDVITYTVEDGRGGTDQASVTVEIEAENDAPIARDDPDNVTTDAGTIDIDVLANDDDVDSPRLEPIVEELPEHGRVEVDDGILRYTAEEGFAGEVELSYVASDGDAESAPATVRIRVYPFVSVDPIDDVLSEAGGPFTVELTLSQPNEDFDVELLLRTRDGTAVGAEDYEAVDEVLVIEQNESGATIEIEIVDDAIDEDTDEETFELTVTVVATGRGRAATLTIADDDDVPE